LRRRLLLAIPLSLIMLLLAVSPCFAVYFKTGNDLVAGMNSYEKLGNGTLSATTDAVNASFYMAYIVGVYDATEYLYNAPGGININQICAVVAKYLKAHPELWAQPAASLVVKALLEAFPK
jgi:hypothetical protein